MLPSYRGDCGVLVVPRCLVYRGILSVLALSHTALLLQTSLSCYPCVCQQAEAASPVHAGQRDGLWSVCQHRGQD